MELSVLDPPGLEPLSAIVVLTYGASVVTFALGGGWRASDEAFLSASYSISMHTFVFVIVQYWISVEHKLYLLLYTLIRRYGHLWWHSSGSRRTFHLKGSIQEKSAKWEKLNLSTCAHSGTNTKKILYT